MPIYEYTCLDCNEDFETIVFRSDEVVCCPKCNKDHLEKKMSKFAFKGSERFVGTGSSSSCGSCSSHNCSGCH
ncbi:MAG TPA: zinc ribbon domain-containing protein [Thermodesulfobacteriota bacterium]|nr:zinc ribbon domain-containing protein [Thermodesulfobacteriota bacterium]